MSGWPSGERTQEALRVLQDLRHAQSRALLSENAAALGKLAAPGHAHPGTPQNGE
jgi:hypothetical protein